MWRGKKEKKNKKKKEKIKMKELFVAREEGLNYLSCHGYTSQTLVHDMQGSMIIIRWLPAKIA